MKRLIMALVIAALGLAFSSSAQAFTQTATGAMNLSATVVASCTITVSPFDFGVIDVAAYPIFTSSLTVNCSNGTPYRIDMDAGLNPLGTDQCQRRLKTGTAPADATNTITYTLDKTLNAMDPWGDNGTTFCTANTIPVTGMTGTGTGADQIISFSAQTWPTTNAPGVYTDTVTVTVNY